MLLGVEDLETEQAYHRGKNRLHNAWLHREGVVWGLRVFAPKVDDRYRDEIEVTAGLALDAAGNELHLEAPACLDIGKWYEDRKQAKELSKDDEVTDPITGDVTVQIEAHVVARFCSCLMRPVPALMEPCRGSGDDTAYSRAYETIELILRPGPPPRQAVLPYRRLRLLFGLPDPDPGEPVDEQLEKDIVAVTEADEADRARILLDAFRVHAAHDVMDLTPAGTGEAYTYRYPLEDRPPLLLAHLSNIELRHARGESAWHLITEKIDNAVRPSHVATRTIQELLCGSLASGMAAPAAPAAPARRGGPRPVAVPPHDADAGGPRIDADTLKVKNKRIEFATDQPLAARSVGKGGVDVFGYDAKRGWLRRSVESVRY